MRYLFRIPIIVIIATLVSVCISIFVNGLYPIIHMCVNFFSSTTKIVDLKPMIQSIPTTLIYITIAIIVIILFLSLRYDKKIIAFTTKIMSLTYTSIKSVFSSLSLVELSIIAIPVLCSIYFAFVIPVSYDEAMTYNLFTSKPFFYAAIFYPYPNNHVLHSLITNAFEYIPFTPILFNIRIPAILSNMFTWILVLSFFKRYFSSKAALNAVGLASVFYMTIYYSFMSRGYAFMVLCVVICFYALFNIISKNNRKKDWFFFGVGAILGLYTIPSFLYALVTINVLLLIFNFRKIQYLIISNIAIGVITLLLYSPIILVDGYAALSNNQFVQKIPRVDILKGIMVFYQGMITNIIGVPLFLSFFLLIPTIFVWKDKRKIIFWLVIMLAPFFLIFTHSVHPFYRTFLYYNFFFVFLLTLSLQTYIEKIPTLVIYTYILIIQVMSIYHFNLVISVNEGFNTDVNTVVQEYFEPENTIIFPCIASANYEFEAKVRKLESQIIFLNVHEASADTIQGTKYVIIEKERDQTCNLKPYAQSKNQNIYKISD